MNLERYKTEFSKKALQIGYSQQKIDKCMDYAQILFGNNVPIIFTEEHFSKLVGYRLSYLKKAATFPDYYYRNFEIVKNNGSKRSISEPLPSLKEIHYWILHNILEKIEVSPFAKAYRRKVKLTENVRFHKNQKKVYALDLKDFFTSIKTTDIHQIFRKIGYSESVSNLLAKLCCKNGNLPQGAPTSPYLSNIFFKPLDSAISDYCKLHSIRYTRYADDLSFSGNFDEKELYTLLAYVLEKSGLTLNREKTKLMTQNTRQTITGVVVNNKPQVVFHKRNALRNAMYYIQRFGLNEHIRHEKIKQKNYLEHLLGKINFVLHINPSDAEFLEYKTLLINYKVLNGGQKIGVKAGLAAEIH
jgi:RNA-directed DNA polymerase